MWRQSCFIQCFEKHLTLLETLPKTIAFLASPMSFIMIFQSEPWQERWGEISSSLVWWNPSSSSCQTAAAQHTAVCKHTWGLCWKWFNLAHAIQLVTTLPTPPPPTHTSHLPKTLQPEARVADRASLIRQLNPGPPSPSGILEIHFPELLLWPATRLSCFHPIWHDRERAALLLLTQARQCAWILDQHLQVYGKSSLCFFFHICTCIISCCQKWLFYHC